MKLVKEHINEKFKEDSDPIKDLGMGIIHKITSDALSYLNRYGIEDIEDMRKEQLTDNLADQILAALNLQSRGIIEVGNFFDWKDDVEMWDYITENRMGRYYYDGSPRQIGTLVIFSKIELPSADEIA